MESSGYAQNRYTALPHPESSSSSTDAMRHEMYDPVLEGMYRHEGSSGGPYTAEELEAQRRKRYGRPPGAKDKKPRRRRTKAQMEEDALLYGIRPDDESWNAFGHHKRRRLLRSSSVGELQSLNGPIYNMHSAPAFSAINSAPLSPSRSRLSASAPHSLILDHRGPHNHHLQQHHHHHHHHHQQQQQQQQQHNHHHQQYPHPQLQQHQQHQHQHQHQHPQIQSHPHPQPHPHSHSQSHPHHPPPHPSQHHPQHQHQPFSRPGPPNIHSATTSPTSGHHWDSWNRQHHHQHQHHQQQQQQQQDPHNAGYHRGYSPEQQRVLPGVNLPRPTRRSTSPATAPVYPDGRAHTLNNFSWHSSTAAAATANAADRRGSESEETASIESSRASITTSNTESRPQYFKEGYQLGEASKVAQNKAHENLKTAENSRRTTPSLRDLLNDSEDVPKSQRAASQQSSLQAVPSQFGRLKVEDELARETPRILETANKQQQQQQQQQEEKCEKPTETRIEGEKKVKVET